MALWQPSDLGLALVGWFDASDTPTVVNSGSGVSQWTNKAAGSTFTLTQTVDANRPVWSASAHTIRFDTVSGNPVNDQFLQATNGPVAYDFALYGIPHTVVNGSFHAAVYNAPGNAVMLVDDYGRLIAFNGALADSGLSFLMNTPGVTYCTASDHTAVAFTQNGSALATTSATMPTAYIQVGRIGGGGESNSLGFGEMGEIVFTTFGLATSDRQKLEGYLAWKWGTNNVLPTSHPYYPAPPQTSGSTVDLAGSMVPAVSLAAPLAVDPQLAGQIAPTVSLSAGMGVDPGLVGAVAPTISLAADLTVTAASTVDLAGSLAPATSLAAGLGVDPALVGALVPTISFAADLTAGPGAVVDLAGGFAPVTTLGAGLTAATTFVGGFAVPVTFGGYLGSPIDLAGTMAIGVGLSGHLALTGEKAPSRARGMVLA